MEENKSKFNKQKIKNITIFVVFSIVCIIGCIYLWPYVKKLSDKNNPQYQEQFIAWVKSLGLWGVLLLISIFIIQMLLAVIPSAPFEIISGLMYGVFGGLIICLIGSTIGSVVIIYLVRQYGKSFADKGASDENHKYLKFMDSPERTGIIMFSILIMPGLPKDFLVYLVPFTKLKTSSFLIINALGRTPNILLSLLIGNSLKTGDYVISITFTVIAIVISAFGLIYNKKIVDYFTKKKNKNNE